MEMGSNMRAFGSLRTKLAQWRHSREGNIAVISALVLPALVGFAGLGADAGYWYYRQRVLQGAADITAFNGVVAKRGGASGSSIISAAPADAVTNGWNAAQGTITVHTPPTSGTHQTANAVEVILTETQPRFFSKVFSSSPVVVQARAVGSYAASGIACVLALNKTANRALQFWGNNLTTLNGCNVAANSFANDGIAVGGSSSVTVPCAISSGGVAVTSTLNLTSCPNSITNAPLTPDPYGALPAPPIGACGNLPNTATLNAGCYNGFSVNNTRTLNPGIYVINGGTLSLNGNANISGSGVMFYLTNGAKIQINGSAHMNLSAATSGTYSGMLFYGNRTQPTAVQTFNGDASSRMTGAIYFPSQEVRMNGNFSGANGCQQVIGDTIQFSGSTTLSAACPGTGINSIPIPGSTALVE